MAALANLARPYISRYEALLAEASPSDALLVSFMVDHERSLTHIAEREAVGEGLMDRELLVKLTYPIARVSHSLQRRAD